MKAPARRCFALFLSLLLFVLIAAAAAASAAAHPPPPASAPAARGHEGSDRTSKSGDISVCTYEGIGTLRNPVR